MRLFSAQSLVLLAVCAACARCACAEDSMPAGASAFVVTAPNKEYYFRWQGDIGQGTCSGTCFKVGVDGDTVLWNTSSCLTRNVHLSDDGIYLAEVIGSGLGVVPKRDTVALRIMQRGVVVATQTVYAILGDPGYWVLDVAPMRYQIVENVIGFKSISVTNRTERLGGLSKVEAIRAFGLTNTKGENVFVNVSTGDLILRELVAEGQHKPEFWKYAEVIAGMLDRKMWPEAAVAVEFCEKSQKSSPLFNKRTIEEFHRAIASQGVRP